MGPLSPFSQNSNIAGTQILQLAPEKTDFLSTCVGHLEFYDNIIYIICIFVFVFNEFYVPAKLFLTKSKLPRNANFTMSPKEKLTFQAHA